MVSNSLQKMKQKIPVKSIRYQKGEIHTNTYTVSMFHEKQS